MLTIKEIVQLAAAGYKPADVKELIEMSKETEPQAPDIDQNAPPSDQTELSNMTSEAEGGQSEITASTSTLNQPPSAEVDYKKLYEEQKETLEAIQAANRNRDISDELNNESDEDILLNYIEEFFR